MKKFKKDVIGDNESPIFELIGGKDIVIKIITSLY